MSCHDIGAGMASVAETVLDLFDKQEIGRLAACTILSACRRGVHWCDGNEEEVYVEMLDDERCGMCLKTDQKLSEIDKTLYKANEKRLAHPYLCPSCTEKLREEKEPKKQEGRAPLPATQSLEELPLSTAIRHMLYRSNIFDVGHILRLERIEQLYRVRGLGKKSMQDVIEALKKAGYTHLYNGTPIECIAR